MSHITLPYVPCPDIQLALNDAWSSCQRVREPLPLLSFLRSPLNTDGFIQNQVDQKNGNLRNVEFVYTPRVLEEEVSSSINWDSCTTTERAGQLSETYSLDITDGAEYEEGFSIDDMTDFCADNADWAISRLQDGIDGVLRKVETMLHEDLAAQIGGFANNDVDHDGTVIQNDIKTIETLDANGNVSRSFSRDILYSARQAMYCSVPFVFGTRPATLYMEDVESGCCANEGIDLGDFARKHSMVYFDDYRVSSVGQNGENSVFSIAAGAAQMLTFSLYQGKFNERNDSASPLKRFTLIDPGTGVPIDILHNEICNDINWFFRVVFDLWTLPTDIFSVGDRLNGVTWVNEYNITN